MCIGIVTGICKALSVAVGPDHAVAENDEQRVARKGFGVEQINLVAKVDVQIFFFD